MIELTDEQSFVIDEMIAKIKNSNVGRYQKRLTTPFSTTVGGYAGTGKTTLLSELRKEIFSTFGKFISVAFMSFTGKASSVMSKKLYENGAVFGDDYIGTIHGLIYKAKTKWDPVLKTHVIVGWDLKEKNEVYHNLFIIDEASMISKKIWRDLLKFENPIIAVGDHGQLPPVSNDVGYFNLMQYPEYKLTKIHRQALDSPIIWLSKFIRENKYIPFNKVFAPGAFKLSWNQDKCKDAWNSINFDMSTMVLCGFNTTRANLNDKIRKKLKYRKILPYPGEPIICLRNNHKIGLMNGQIGKVVWMMPVRGSMYRVTLDIEGDMLESMLHLSTFGQVQYTMFDKSKEIKKSQEFALKHDFNLDFFDYGYVTSVHKAQGSEWNRVVLIEQRSKHWDDDYWARWLYTGVTRAIDKIFIISDFWG